jgi:Co/Zn/Cd efflux system component
MILALIGFSEVIRRVFSNQPLPHFKTMILISFFALIANSFCLWIMHKSKNKQEAHMRASMIFTSNDVIINLGVMLTGVLVHLLQSGAPDLIIGSIVFALVLNGARRMLRV